MVNERRIHKMPTKQKVKIKLFKVFYFPKPDDYYFSKVEMIMAKNEAEAEAIKPQPIYDSIGNYVGMLGPMVVVCAHRNTCRRFMEYLQKCLIKERMKEKYDKKEN